MRKIVIYIIAMIIGIAACFGGLFVVNGVFLANGEKPLSGMISRSSEHDIFPNEIRISFEASPYLRHLENLPIFRYRNY